jgi:hypothetical protein
MRSCRTLKASKYNSRGNAPGDIKPKVILTLKGSPMPTQDVRPFQGRNT